MSEVQCFWVHDTGRCLVALRRYGEGCASGTTYCNAIVPVGSRVEQRDERGYVHADSISVWEFDGDERWPTKCEGCGREFTTKDKWQVWTETIWTDGKGNEWPQRRLPAGAMLDAVWLHETAHVGADGVSLVVVTPGAPDDDTRGAWWNVDMPASNGGNWSREGDPKADPPTVSAHPSIQTDRYHGWLRNGKLVD